MRGFACLVMFQTHCYDSWLGGAARKTQFFAWSQLGGTLPAPLFLFLAGVSVALATDRSWQQGIAPGRIARSTMLRGLEVFGCGLLFRVQEFLLGQPWAPWTDLLRVDVLNIIGLSIVFLGALDRSGFLALASLRRAAGKGKPVRSLPLSACASVWRRCWPHSESRWLRRLCGQRYRPRWLPWYLESYVNGVHIFDKPQPWLFPLFPWCGIRLRRSGDRLLSALSVGTPPRTSGDGLRPQQEAPRFSPSVFGWTRSLAVSTPSTISGTPVRTSS